MIRVINNEHHVLQPLVPERNNMDYNLRPRNHDRQLMRKSTYINNSLFIVRMFVIQGLILTLLLYFNIFNFFLIIYFILVLMLRCVNCIIKRIYMDLHVLLGVE